MYVLVLIIHVIVCLVLVFVVLLQAGRGGGFSEMLGGGQPQTLFGTQTNAFMTKATEVCAVLFIITSLTLGILSSQRGKSLVGHQMAASEIQAKLKEISEKAAAQSQQAQPAKAVMSPDMPVTPPAVSAPAAPAASAPSPAAPAEANAT